MLLNFSIFIILILNIFFSDIKILGVLFILLLLINIFCNKNMKSHAKSLKILLFFYIGTFIIQLFYNQEGKILFQIYKFYITDIGLINFLTNFIRIFNLVLISWLVSARNILKGKLGSYQNIVEIVISLVPEVFVLFRKRIKLKTFFRHILKQIRLKYESHTT